MEESALIPTGRKMKGYACMRSLHRKGVHTVVASEHDRIPHSASRYCGERVRVPSPWCDLVAYKDALLTLASRPDVETILPVRECDVYVFAKWGQEFDEHVRLVSPPLESLRRVHDRHRLGEVAERIGVPVPETRLLSEADGWNCDTVVKSRYNVLAGAYVDGIPDERLAEMKQIRFVPAGERVDTVSLSAELRHEPIVQEYVPQTDKILYCALWDRGEPLATYQHRQIRQNSWVGGGGVYRVSVHSPEVANLAERLLGQLDWHGVVCIEYLRDERTGEWTFIEVNPRLWQSLPEAVRANVDFPYYYWLLSQGAAENVDAAYDAGIGCHNAYGEVGHLLSTLRDESPFRERPSFWRTVWQIGTSCVRTPRFDYIRLDDPQFFLAAGRETLASGVSPSREYNTTETSERRRRDSVEREGAGVESRFEGSSR